MGLCEGERGGELGTLCDGQVLLLPELPLQSQELGCGEGRAGLSVGLVFPQLAARTDVTYRGKR